MIKKKIIKTITRKELYGLVWSKPIMDISKEFGLSDRGLGKVCERYDIPKPPRGYWQKLSAGEKIKIPKLPKIKDKWRENIRIEGTIDAQMSTSVSKKIVEQTPEQIVVPSRLSKTHPLVKETEKSIRKELRHRRNLILNSLFLELEKHDYQIEIEEGYFKISFEKEHLYLKISEHLKEFKRPFTEKEEKNKFYSFQKWFYEYEETGKLKISLHEWIPAHYSSALIRSFIDLKDKLIETKINDIYLVIIEYLLSKREKRLKDEEVTRLRKEKEKQERIKNKKREILGEETQNFLLAKNIRKYVESKEKAFKDNKVKMIDFEKWKIFALNYADELDSSFQPEKEIVVDENPYNWY
jgi:hypothetical protein